MTVAPPPTDAERLTVTLPWPVRAAWPNAVQAPLFGEAAE